VFLVAPPAPKAIPPPTHTPVHLSPHNRHHPHVWLECTPPPPPLRIAPYLCLECSDLFLLSSNLVLLLFRHRPHLGCYSSRVVRCALGTAQAWAARCCFCCCCCCGAARAGWGLSWHALGAHLQQYHAQAQGAAQQQFTLCKFLRCAPRPAHHTPAVAAGAVLPPVCGWLSPAAVPPSPPCTRVLEQITHLLLQHVQCCLCLLCAAVCSLQLRLIALLCCCQSRLGRLLGLQERATDQQTLTADGCMNNTHPQLRTAQILCQRQLHQTARMS
jgi:hypothetical protein